MEIKDLLPKAKKVSIKKEGLEVARGRIYFIENDLGHNQPYAFLEDIHVEEEHRSQGLGKEIVKALIEEAKKENCYKVVGNSRFNREKVHQFYSKLGFKEHGKCFRLDL